MQMKHQDFSQLLFWSDVLTFIYVPGFISFLYYHNKLQTGECFDNYYTIFIFVIAEMLKYSINAIQDRSLIRKTSVKEFFKGFLTLALIFGVIYVVAVLFGAPVFSHFQETSIFALLATTLTAFPTCLYLGSDTTNNMFLSLTSYDADNFHKLFMLKIRLPLFGAWLGAFVIPLDWNRPWQEWPVPCCIGALLGYTAANFMTSLLQLKKKKTLKKTGKYTL